jgi:hypothetical protein
VTGLVLEVYTGERPEDVDELLSPVLAELAARGFAAGPGQTTRLVEQRASRRGIADDVTTEALRGDINTGYQKFLTGDYDAAVALLARSLRFINSNPALVALDQTMQPLHMRALIGLALSLRRMDQEAEATTAMSELARSFPTADISTREYGPEPVKFHAKVLAGLKEGGTGQLVVETDDQAAVIFVNESFRGVSRIDAVLPAGPYRVYIQRGKEIGRAYDVLVEKDRSSRLVVDSKFDAAIRTEAKWTGLVLPDAPDLEAQAIEYAARLGRAVGVRRVILLGLRKREEGLHLVGTVVSMSGRRVARQASLSIGLATPEAARAALGRFLAGEEPTDELEVAIQDGKTVVRGDSRPSPSPWKWVATTGAVAALATGIVLIQLDGSCRGGQPAGGAVCRDLWDTSAAGWTAVGVAGALGITAGYLFWRDARRQREWDMQVAVVPGSGGVRVLAGFEF